ncbi:MAG: LysR family transcriptional regulator [Elusimicrobia bacterium]|nr:LysR family transcriptional regulator [Elusimicrobiota bacterium]
MKGTRLHLDLFRVFYDLTQTKSFSRAAAQNYLTQSAVSQQVSFLERHLGRKLIDRGKGRFSLTETGEALLEGSRKILEAYQEVVDRVRHPGQLSGMIRAETVYSIGLYQLDISVKAFLQRYPKVNLHLEYNRSDRIYSDVIHGTCDLGIVAYPWHHPLLRIIPFKKEKLTVVCPPEDALASKGRVRFRALDHKNFVAFDRDIPTRKAIDDVLRRHKVFVNIVQEFDNIETLKRSVEAGSGISILPENTVAQEVKTKTLVCVPISGGTLWRPTGIICRKDRSLSRATKAFVGWLTK